MKLLSTVLSFVFLTQIAFASAPSANVDKAVVAEVSMESFSHMTKKEEKREERFFKKFNRQFDRFAEVLIEDVEFLTAEQLRYDLQTSLEVMKSDSTLSELVAGFERIANDESIDVKAEILKLVSAEGKEVIIAKLKGEIAAAGGFDAFVEETNRQFKFRWCNAARIGAGVGTVVLLAATFVVVPSAFAALFSAFTIQNLAVAGLTTLTMPGMLFTADKMLTRCPNRK